MKPILARLKDIFNRQSITRLIDEAISLGHEPKKIARSLAIGVVIGLVVPVGLQSMLSIPIAIFFECNLILTIVGTLISNPLTVVLLYYIAYEIGTALTGITISFTQIEEMIVDLDIDYFLKLGADAMVVLISGAVVQAVVYGTITYIISYKLIDYYMRGKSKKSRAGNSN